MPCRKKDTLWWFLSLISIYVQKIKTDKSPTQRYWRLKNTWILLAVSISLHAEACLFRLQVWFILFINAYLHSKNQRKISILSKVMTIKKCSNPRAFWGMCSHACSKLIDCSCFFHPRLSTSKKSKSNVNPSFQETFMITEL